MSVLICPGSHVVFLQDLGKGGGGVITIQLNGVPPTIKYTVEAGESDGSLPFWDVSFVKLLCNTLVTGSSSRGHFGDKHSSDFYFVKILRDTLVTGRHIVSF